VDVVGCCGAGRVEVVDKLLGRGEAVVIVVVRGVCVA
jgi:predicted ATPase